MIELDEFERERFQIWCRDVVVASGLVLCAGVY